MRYCIWLSVILSVCESQHRSADDAMAAMRLAESHRKHVSCKCGESRSNGSESCSSQGISLYAANRFDEALGVLCRSFHVEVCYGGSLAYGEAGQNLVPQNCSSDCLWSIGTEKDLVMEVRISTEESPESIARVQVNGCDVFILVGEIAGERSSDDPLYELTGLSAREFLSRLVIEELPADE